MRNSISLLAILGSLLFLTSVLSSGSMSDSNSRSHSQKRSEKSRSPIFSSSEVPSLAPSHFSTSSYSSFKPSGPTKHDERSEAPSISSPEPPSLVPSVQFNHQYPTRISSHMPTSTATFKDRSHAPMISITDAPTSSIVSLKPSSSLHPVLYPYQPTRSPLKVPTSSKPTFDSNSVVPSKLSSESPSSRIISLVPSKSPPVEHFSPSPSIKQNFSSSPHPVKTLGPNTDHPHIPTYFSDDKGPTLWPTVNSTSTTPPTTPHPTLVPTLSDDNLNNMGREQMEWLASRVGPPPPGIKCTVEDDCGSDGTCIHNFCYAFQTIESSVQTSNLSLIIITSFAIVLSMELLV
jgi:hypothetical protein